MTVGHAPGSLAALPARGFTVAMGQHAGPRTTYDTAMAAAYVAGRALPSSAVQAWMTAARPHLPGRSGRLLDIGAGTGRFSTALAQACPATVVACEPSAAMRAACQAFCPSDVRIVAGTAEALPFAEDTFDAVWASQVVHHVEDLPRFAHELRRVLAEGGAFLLRGGFGAVTDIPLYRYFPGAWSADSTHPSLPHITDVLAAAGLGRVAHAQVPQVFAADGDELLYKVGTRSLSPLAALPDAEYHAGVRRLRADVARGAFPGPVTERLDLVVFR